MANQHTKKKTTGDTTPSKIIKAVVKTESTGSATITPPTPNRAERRAAAKSMAKPTPERKVQVKLKSAKELDIENNKLSGLIGDILVNINSALRNMHVATVYLQGEQARLQVSSSIQPVVLANNGLSEGMVMLGNIVNNANKIHADIITTKTDNDTKPVQKRKR